MCVALTDSYGTEYGVFSTPQAAKASPSYSTIFGPTLTWTSREAAPSVLEGVSLDSLTASGRTR